MHPKIAALQLELMRKRSPAERLQLAFAYSAYLMNLSQRQLEQRMSKTEAKIEWVRVHCGEQLAQGFATALREREERLESVDDMNLERSFEPQKPVRGGAKLFI